MKRLLLISLLVLFSLTPPLSVAALEQYRTEAKHSIAIEATTGKILYEQDATTPTSIASITNLLTAYLVYEAIEEGKMDMATPVTISDYAYNLTVTSPVTNLPLDARSYTVKELLEASLIASANSATIALAEKVAGNEAAFVDKMKEKVASWGISDATLVNATGLTNDLLGDNRYPGTKDDAENLLSALDVAIIARRLVLDYPQILSITSKPSFKMNGTLYYGTNWMLKGNSYEREGLDGLKTASGTSMVATSVENDMRVITVVLHTTEGETYPEKRFTETTNLLNYSYQYFKPLTLVEAGKPYHDSQITIFNGKKATISAVAADDFVVVKRVRNKNEVMAETNGLDTVWNAPIEKKTVVGTLTLTDSDLIGHGYVQQQPSIDLLAEDDVAPASWPASWWNYFVRYVNEKL
ncbi:D-alanyl-D-alanine carboxypeptidase PBP3 [Streptococcus marmotae]|uniref:D-alanyl-D-alanine carboxypeptidase PBP3 n=1 Tax=Streptococcus marmotae TaxID=1825069 RepID=UPI00082E43FE|nr:D-alanyl-D-alanine carboxypeptidase PBP3 [Streptococcus marmotae]